MERFWGRGQGLVQIDERLFVVSLECVGETSFLVAGGRLRRQADGTVVVGEGLLEIAFHGQGVAPRCIDPTVVVIANELFGEMHDRVLDGHCLVPMDQARPSAPDAEHVTFLAADEENGAKGCHVNDLSVGRDVRPWHNHDNVFAEPQDTAHEELANLVAQTRIDLDGGCEVGDGPFQVAHIVPGVPRL